MKLEKYRKNNGFSYHKLAEKLEIRDIQNPAMKVYRWCNDVIPRKNEIVKIELLTDGQVKVKDFYDKAR